MSKKIEDFIPPPELCKRIPAGAFGDSVFMLVVWPRDAFEVIAHRALKANDQYFELAGRGFITIYPAPTLEEIMGEMAKNPRYFNNAYCEVDGDGFIVGAFLPNLGNPGSTLTEYRDKSGATAALKLFLHRREQ